MKDFFKELFEYGHHYNQQLAKAINEDPGKVSEKALKLFSHVLNAHQVWNNRIEPGPAPSGIWEIHPSHALSEIDTTSFRNTLLILDKHEPGKNIAYKNLKGQAYSNSVKDILFHIINHSTYHRAQIATEFKQSGIDPLPTDYIFYKWQADKKAEE